jgi:hypothetical protein
VQKKINYLRRRSSRWWKKSRDENRRRKRIRDGRRTRGRGGLRQWRRNMLNRRIWKRQDKKKGRL